MGLIWSTRVRNLTILVFFPTMYILELISGVEKGHGKKSDASREVLIVQILALVTGGFVFIIGDVGGSVSRSTS